MTRNEPPVETQVRSALERVSGYGILPIALAAFFVGVFLHVCVVYAVLDSGGSDASAGPQVNDGAVQITPVVVAPTSTPPADRQSCEAIRGTTYRSDAERDWFRANCS